MLEKLSVDTIVRFFSDYGLKVIGGILVLIIGFWFVGKISKLIGKQLEKNNLDISLREFLVPLISIILKILVVFAAAETVGFKTTSFIAVLGGAALAVGLALQGSLSNFAGGVLILLFKPFKVGDVIESQGFIGTVEKIEVFNTILKNPENKKIILPNGPLYNNPVTNYTENGFLRMDIAVGIAYKENIQKAREIILETVKNYPSVKKDKDITVHVKSLGESSIDLIVRCYSDCPDYWEVFFGLTEAVKIALDNANINIPFPQRELLVTQVNN